MLQQTQHICDVQHTFYNTVLDIQWDELTIDRYTAIQLHEVYEEGRLPSDFNLVLCQSPKLKKQVSSDHYIFNEEGYAPFTFSMSAK